MAEFLTMDEAKSKFGTKGRTNARLSTRISDLEKKEAATAAALPLMFELNKVNAERYTDAASLKLIC